jgi:hypothetical protein
VLYDDTPAVCAQEELLIIIDEHLVHKGHPLCGSRPFFLLFAIEAARELPYQRRDRCTERVIIPFDWTEYIVRCPQVDYQGGTGLFHNGKREDRIQGDL